LRVWTPPSGAPQPAVKIQRRRRPAAATSRWKRSDQPTKQARIDRNMDIAGPVTLHLQARCVTRLCRADFLAPSAISAGRSLRVVRL